MKNRSARQALAAAHRGNIPRPRVAQPSTMADQPDPAVVMNHLAEEAKGVYEALVLRGLPDVLAAAMAAHLVVEPARRRGLNMPVPPQRTAP